MENKFPKARSSVGLAPSDQSSNFEYQGHPHQHFGHITYSQNGEDLMLCNLCKLLKIETPSYMDLGAFSPFQISNTALLYSRGSRGLNVDANERSIQNFNHYRPDDMNLCAAITTHGGPVEYYIFYEDGVTNTCSPEERDLFLKKFPEAIVRETQLVVSYTINQLVEKYFNGVWPDLLLTDLEGMDFKVLESMKMDLNSGPKIIVTETRDSIDMLTMMSRQWYSFYCLMGENMFFIRHDLLKHLKVQKS